MEEIYQRTELVIGKDKLNKLKNSHVLICGIGGVGSYALEALGRIGIGKITIVDKDVVDITNINRQIIATLDNVGNNKVDEAKKRINSINPTIEVKAIKENITTENIHEIINSSYDYVIDAIDSVDAKIAIIESCKDLNIQVISSMGTANKLNPLDIKITDINKTEVCPLARVVRKKLKGKNIKNVKVVYSTEQAIKNDSNILGSVSFVPSVAGLVIASEVVKDLIK